MRAVSDQYMADMYCCAKGVTLWLVLSGVEPGGTRCSHERPTESA